MKVIILAAGVGSRLSKYTLPEFDIPEASIGRSEAGFIFELTNANHELIYLVGNKDRIRDVVEDESGVVFEE